MKRRRRAGAREEVREEGGENGCKDDRIIMCWKTAERLKSKGTEREKVHLSPDSVPIHHASFYLNSKT